MSHNFGDAGRCSQCGQLVKDLTRGADGKLPLCPDAPVGKHYHINTPPPALPVSFIPNDFSSLCFSVM